MRERILGGRLGESWFDRWTDLRELAGSPSNKGLQLTPNSAVQSIRGTVLASGLLLQR